MSHGSSAKHCFFGPQAEMINLKAQFLAALGEDDSAHATFSEALMLFTLCSEAWVSQHSTTHSMTCTGAVPRC